MKNGIFRGIALLFSLAVPGAFISAQQQPDSLLTVLDQQYPQEKIYVHFDRPYYNPGEIIWFKAYVFAANLPSLISKTVYAELIDDKGNIMERKTIPVLGASAASDFQLPDSMRTSVVYIRAYTSWMLNFDSSFLYLKPVPILARTAAADKAKKDPVYSLQFFPEGGDLVQGLESRIAFKAVDGQGLPIKVKGDVLDSKGQKVTAFADMHDGMGYFLLAPAAGEKYKAVWKDAKGVPHETPLPAAKAGGTVFSVSNTGAAITYAIHRTDDVPTGSRVFMVVAQMQQQPVYMARINLAVKTQVTAPIPVENLNDGIMQVTLFDEANQPLAERIVFVNQGNYYFITDLHATEKNLTRKAKNTIQIDISDTLVTNLSIAITDAGTTAATGQDDNIFSHVLLSSDIRGYVHNPAYYFSSTADSVRDHLDLVMMTNGWRRFKWEDVLAGRFPAVKHYPEPYVSIAGKVLGIRESELVDKELSVILKTQKNTGQFLMVPVNRKGEFVINDLIFYDTAKLYYQFNNDKNKRLTSLASFDFRNSFIGAPTRPLTGIQPVWMPVLPDSLTRKKNELLTRQRMDEFFEGQKVKLLEGVEVTARQKTPQQKMDEEYTSGLFRGGDGYTFLTSDDPFARSAMSVLAYLQGKVPGLTITGNGPDAALSWRGGTPSLFMNEMNTDVDMIQSISMNDVAMIKVFRPPFFGAVGGGAGGAIAVYTKKGELANNSVSGLNFVSVVGYSPVREFYSPDYTTADKNKNDYRTTLYWNPYLLFDKNNRRISIPFYNNDNAKKIRVIIEGINEQGKLTREEKIFE
ncbi:MAG: hypothetical protein ABW019_02515 [Chitinophagaceae bacterium]